MTRNLNLLLSTGMILLLLLVATLASAQEGAVLQDTEAAAVTPALLQYQGRLSEPGTGEALADGAYTMALRLYAEPSGGKALWSEVKDVPLSGGLFSTVLGDTSPLNRELFNGRALWLGIKVGSDVEAKPRQQVLPVAYALSLVPGAEIAAKSSSAILSITNSGSGPALTSDGAVIIDGGLTVNGKLKGSHAADADAHHARYTDAEAVSAALSSSGIVTQYEFQDHIYGGWHDGRALAMGAINGDGSVASATNNVSSKWLSGLKCYEITISGHSYNWQSYVTVVTPILGISNAWGANGKLRVGIYDSDGNAIKQPFHFTVFKPY